VSEGRISRWAGPAAVVSAAAALVSAIAATGVLEGEGSDPGHLKIAEPKLVLNRSGPKIRLVVTNTGDAPVHVPRVHVAILDYADVWQCVAQGGGDDEESKPYVVLLPVHPLPDEREIDVKDVPKTVAPGTPQKLELRFGSMLGGPAFRLYALRVTIVSEDPDGEAVAGVFAIINPGPVRLYATWCFRHNIAAVKRVLSSGEVDRKYVGPLRHLTLAAGWPRRADDTPPRRAAIQLLAGAAKKYLAEPELAVIASDATGDPQFGQEIRRRAASALLERSAGRPDEVPAYAEDDVRRSLMLHRSARAERLLQSLKRRTSTTGRTPGRAPTP
jgi:translation elongation factor EF-1beta